MRVNCVSPYPFRPIEEVESPLRCAGAQLPLPALPFLRLLLARHGRLLALLVSVGGGPPARRRRHHGRAGAEC